MFAHPNDRSKVLKVKYERDGKASSYRHWLREKHAFRQIKKRLEDDPNPPFSKFYGSVATDMGPADVFEAFYGPKGVRLAPTLRHFFRVGEFNKVKLGHLNGLIQKIDKWDVPVSDMHAGNVVFSERQGELQFVLVDGLGDYRWIPTARWSSRVRRERLAEECKRLTIDRDLHWDDDARQFRF